MSRPALEVAYIFRGHGPAWRQANAGHVSLGQLKVMSAIERCRTAALGGHVVPCGGISLDGSRGVSCRPRFFLPVPVFSKLFRGLMLVKLLAAHKAGQLKFFNQYARLAESKAFARYL